LGSGPLGPLAVVLVAVLPVAGLPVLATGLAFPFINLNYGLIYSHLSKLSTNLSFSINQNEGIVSSFILPLISSITSKWN
jgi:hypothetical protein